MFFKSSEFKIILLYVFTSVSIYLGFWLGYYCLSYVASLAIAGCITLVAGILFACLRKHTVAPIICTILFSAAIGIAMSAIFTAFKIAPSRFFGLVLLIMLAYVGCQAGFLYFLPSRKAANVILIILAIAEIALCIAVGVNTGKNPALLWQVFCALLICVFYTFGLMIMQNSTSSNFWRTAALCYLIGFVIIFVVIVLLVISMLAEDGSPFEAFGEFIGEGLGGIVDGGSGRKARKNIQPIDLH